MKKQSSGFSLIEILIASAVLVSVLIGLSVLMSHVIRSDTQAASRVVASELVQEAADFFRYERDFLGFQRLKSNLTTNTFCLNTLEHSESINDPFSLVSGACGTEAYEIEVDRVSAKFKREAEVTINEVIEIEIIVSWETDRGEAEVTSTLFLQPY